MKKIICIILSFQFIILPTSYGQTGPVLNKNSSLEKLTKDNTPDVGENKEYDSNSQQEGGYGFFAKQILNLSTSIVGANIIQQCSLGLKIPSVATFMVGSFAHIASEMTGAKQQNENHRNRDDYIEKFISEFKSQGGDVQRELINQRVIEEEEKLKFFKKRNTWIQAVTAIYFGAMALAISEEVTGTAAGMTAGVSACQGIAATLAAPCGKKYPICYAKHMGACVPFQPTGALASKAAFMSPASIPTGLSVCSGGGPYAPACIANHTAYHSIAYAGCLPFSVGSGLMGKLMATALVGAYSHGLNNTTSSQMTKYMVLVSGLLQLLVPSLQLTVMGAYNYPIPRSVTFGASAALAGAVSMGLQGRISTIEENIKRLKKVQLQFRNQTDDDSPIESDREGSLSDNLLASKGSLGFQSGNLGSSGTNLNSSKSVVSGITRLPQLSNLKPKKVECLSQNSEGFELSTKACVNPVRLARVNNLPLNTNETLQRISNLSTDFANNLNSGNLEQANLNAQDLGNLNSAAKKIAYDLLNEAKNNPESGFSKLGDFDKKILEKTNELNDELLNAAKKGGFDLTPSNLALASNESNSKTNLDNTNIKDVSSEIDLNRKSDLLNPAVDTSSDDNNVLSEGNILSGVDNNSKEQFSNKDLLNAISANGLTGMDEKTKSYSLSEKGISSNPDISLFKQVSHRYFANYQKFFVRKKAEPVVKE